MRCELNQNGSLSKRLIHHNKDWNYEAGVPDGSSTRSKRLIHHNKDWNNDSQIISL